MSSTEDDVGRKRRLEKFYDRHLASLAERLAARGAELIPGGPDEAESWYEPPPERMGDLAEFEFENCAEIMRGWWSAGEFPELAELAGPLAELAVEMEVGEEESDDVSPFVYVMY